MLHKDITEAILLFGFLTNESDQVQIDRSHSVIQILNIDSYFLCNKNALPKVRWQELG